MRSGAEGATSWLETLIKGIRMTIALTGSRTVLELRQAPRIIGPDLERWLAQGTLRNASIHGQPSAATATLGQDGLMLHAAETAT